MFYTEKDKGNLIWKKGSICLERYMDNVKLKTHVCLTCYIT